MVALVVKVVPFKVRGPDIDKLERVPKEVIFGCAAVVKVPVIFPETFKLESVPKEVIFG